MCRFVRSVNGATSPGEDFGLFGLPGVRSMIEGSRAGGDVVRRGTGDDVDMSERRALQNGAPSVTSREERIMAIVHRERQLPDWLGFTLPEWWRRAFDLEPERGGWLRMEEYEEDGALVLRTEAPGIDPEKDVEITIGDGVLRIRAHREQKDEQKGKKGFRSEFRYGELTRTMRLPEGVSGDDVKASYKDGILEVRIPVTAEKEPEVKKVPVTKV